MDVCDSLGGTRSVVSKSSGKQLYRSARKAMWGDAFNMKSLRETSKTKHSKIKHPWIAKMLQRKVKRGEITEQNMRDMLMDRRNQRDRKLVNAVFPHELE